MQNELNPSQNVGIPPSPTKIGRVIVIPPEIYFRFPPIAGFWRRLLAWLIDTLILGLIGQLIGLIFSSFFFTIGLYGRFIGLALVIPYFGIMNSKIGGGQTLGKRVMKIAVRNKRNEPIELWRSLIRILLLATPMWLNGWALPIFQNSIVAWFVSILVFGLGGGILYTMVFNRKARQGIHDLLLGTYVVHLPRKPVESAPVTTRTHWIVTGIWIGLVAIGALVLTFVSPTLVSKKPIQPLQGLYEILQRDPRFFTVGIKDRTTYVSNENPSRTMIITVWYKGKIAKEDVEEVMNSVVKNVLDTGINLNAYDGIQINVTSAFDIGIATQQWNYSNAYSIEGWRNIIYPDGSSNGSTS